MYRLPFALLIAACAGCTDEATPSTTTEALCDHGGPVFARDSHPYGASLETWSERAIRWIYAQPAAHNPMLDTTGADCGVGQDGPVWFLPPSLSREKVITRTCTIPRHRAVLLDPLFLINDYPCPDPTYHPGPGQSLYDFLLSKTAGVLDDVTLMEASLDGGPAIDLLSDRFLSDDLFHVKGDLSLVQPWDSCITGAWQPAVADSFAVMFKPLTPGAHTLRVHRMTTKGADRTVIYDLTVDE